MEVMETTIDKQKIGAAQQGGSCGSLWMRSLCGCRGLGHGWDWSWVDQVYCINLRERVDRLLESQCEFHRVGLCDKLLFYRPPKPADHQWQEHIEDLKDEGAEDAIMTVTKGAYGCWTSHKAVAEHALKHGYKRVLVFEDDVTFLPSCDRVIVNRDIPRALDALPEGADFLHLGYFPIRGKPVIHDGVSDFGKLWSVNALCTVAYVATAKGLNTIRNAAMTLPIDFWIIKHAQQYALFPKIAWQRKSPTDVDELWLNLPSTYVKELGNYFYRRNQTLVDSFMLIALPIIITLILIIFLAFAVHLTKHLLIPHSAVALQSHPAKSKSQKIRASS